MSRSRFRIGVVLFAVAVGTAGSAKAQQQMVGVKDIASPTGGTLEISEWTDNFLRHKYSVINKEKEGHSGQRWWFAQNGSANAGHNEAPRHTSSQEWCRVRYIYGDSVRIPECWGEFMYSSHVITGIDGMHYELWFSPSSLSYFKIRTQENGIWYAHDGSANDGRQRTSKEDWCRVIYYHMLGIIKLPNECQDTQTKIVNAIAGTSGKAAQETELLRVQRMMGIAGRHEEVTSLSNAAPGEDSAGVQFATTLGLDTGSAALETGFDKIASGSVAYDKLNFARNGGLKVMQSSSGGAQAVQFGAGVGVGIAVGYGVDAIKKAAGWTAKDANAGHIAAEVITTTVASSALTTAIMTVAGASFNPVAAGVGLLIAGSVAGGQEIKKASEDTGIRFEPGYDAHPRYLRDLNGIHSTVFTPRTVEGTFEWEECAAEGGRCEFSAVRTIRYGAGDKWVSKPFADAVNCNAGSFDNQDPAPGVTKHCEAPVNRGENLNFTDCAGEGERCDFSGTRVVAYGANQSWVEKVFTDGVTCDYKTLGDPAPGVAKRCAVFLHKNEVPRWIYCGWEGETCNVPGTRKVRYGARGKFVERTATGSVGCSYRTLGDPIPGVGKGCEVMLTVGDLRKWQDCGGEGQRCAFTGVRVVRYGTSGRYNFRTVKDGVSCDYRTLGDPAPGVAKRCSVAMN